MTDDDPPPPKRRRKPPKGLEGFDTGYADADDDAAPTTAEPEASGGIPRKPLWTESTPQPASSDAPIDTRAPSGEGTQPVAGAIGYTPEDSGQPTLYSDESPFGNESPYSAAVESGATFGLGYPAASSGSISSSAAPSASGSISSSIPTSTSYASVSSTDAGLRDAVGVQPKTQKRAPTFDNGDIDDDFEGGGRRWSRKMIAIIALSLVVGLGIGAMIFLGHANSGWFYISCEPDRIVAEQGRAFPPWGESTLGGKPWAAIKIPPDAECVPLATENEDLFEGEFRSILIKRASTLLTAKEVTKADEASVLLEQALLHARANTDAARNARGDIQRLLGDVAYWRAAAKMRDASKALTEAAKQFDAAAQQRPRHVTDAAGWADYLQKVVGELEAGPDGAAPASMPTPTSSEPRTPAPPGVALPVEPPAAGSASEAPLPPDAGVSSGGGVLL